MNLEVWKDIEGFEGLYQVSNLGNVKSLEKNVSCHKIHLRKQKEMILSPSKCNDRYITFSLSKNKKRKYLLAHRLVATAFIPNPDGKTEVNHIDGNRQNNTVGNLEWATRSENMQHSYSTLNRINPKPMKGRFGNDNPLSKRISQKTLNGNTVKIWDSMHDAFRAGYNLGNILSCCKGRRKSHKGFIWDYLQD